MLKTYKILLSAYACEPYRGSEPGVGWNWALELAKQNNKVWVFTRTNNKSVIDKYFSENEKNDNLNFIYYDLPKWILLLKRYGLSVNLYYLLWQIGLVKKAKKQHKLVKFDLVHHITFGVFRHPSFLYKLKIPLIFGPVGGGEFTPKGLTKTYDDRYRFTEKIRNFINKFAVYNPFLIKLLKKSTLILTKTEQTKETIPYRFQNKTINYLEIGINKISPHDKVENKEVFSVLFVGRLIYWKGLDIAISAFEEFAKKSTRKVEFTIVGKGNYKERLKTFIQQSNLNEKVKIVDWMPQEKLKSVYLKSDVLLFPSLHDSSGNVVLEALSFGLPVICLDCGGPAAIVGKEFNDLIVSTNNRTAKEIENSITNKLEMLANNSSKLELFSRKAKGRANEMTWESTVINAYKIIEKLIN